MSSHDTSTDKKHIGVAPISIEKELKTSFLDYAMSVIVSRALPDVRDGLKPVHRRILYAMHQLGYYHTKAHRKSATVVGEVIGRYHPHGDQAIYNAMAGLVQDFSKRYPLLDGQGNWGSIDGDNAAAMRYTEVRMAKIAQEILADIEKNTVSFTPNYDESTVEPTLLPSKIPNLLVNGSNGIAVGMATFIPPHNLREVIGACIELVSNPQVSDEKIFELVPAPDFPTGGIICGRSGIVKAYKTGHGKVVLRAVVDIEENKKHTALVVKEIPFQVNKSDLITKIADLVKNKVVESISNLRDESDRRGIRLVIELKRGESPHVLLNQLYKHSQLQSSVSILLLALYQNRPQIFTLREMLEHFVLHRREMITRRTQFDLDKCRARAHVLEGLVIALHSIDDVVALIKKSSNAEEAIEGLEKKFKLSAIQSKAILEMRLQRLTGLERERITAEMEELRVKIEFFLTILNDERVLKAEIIKELKETRDTYGDERRSRIEGAVDILSEADLVPDEEVVVTLTHKGYIKRVGLDTYEVQHRGGKGKKGMADLDDSDDVMQDLFVAKNHDTLLFFTSLGRVYSMQVFEVPEGSRTARGRAIVNLLSLVENERVVKLLCMREMEGKNLVLITKSGTIKKTDATSFSNIRSSGIRAVTLNEGDELVFCSVTTGSDTIVIATRHGYGIHFKEEEVRAMGRQAAGVRGIKLRKGDYVVGLEVISDGADLLFATEHGYGKRVAIEDFRVAHRGGLGVRTIPVDKRNGSVIGLVQVFENSNILLIDKNGKIIRLSPSEVRTMGRQAKGVRLIRLDGDQVLASVVAFQEEGDEPTSGSGGEGLSAGVHAGSKAAPKKAAIKAADEDGQGFEITDDPRESEIDEGDDFDDDSLSIEARDTSNADDDINEAPTSFI
jgi:DNA gyrase subunit A